MPLKKSITQFWTFGGFTDYYNNERNQSELNHLSPAEHRQQVNSSS
ncbi:IS3 family transposase [Brevibacillus humidisoli]